LYDIPNRCKSYDKINGVHENELVTEDLDYRLSQKYSEKFKERTDILETRVGVKNGLKDIKICISKIGRNYTEGYKQKTLVTETFRLVN